MGMLRILSRHGDECVAWDTQRAESGDPESRRAVREAERIFLEQRQRGATAFRVGQPSVITRVDEFDPAAEQIVMVPRIVGG